MKNKIKGLVENWMPRMSLIIVTVAPLIDWVIAGIQSNSKKITNPYSAWDFHLILIFSVLNLMYEQIIDKRENVGDESNILLNRNQSDYYEIWEVCKKRSYGFD